MIALPTNYPQWVKPEYKTYYSKLVNNPELLEQVAKVYATTSGNANIAAAVIPLGFCKGNGTALDSANISRLKTVVMELNQ